MTTAVLIKRELILNGLTCAHCAGVIEDTIKNIDGVCAGSLNFVNKKLVLQIDGDYSQDDVIGQVIKLIDAIEPGLDINIVENNKKSVNKKELILNGLNCAHCSEVINEKVGALDKVKSCNLNFINKKLSLEIEDGDEELTLQQIIDTINSIESGLNISINSIDKKVNQEERIKSKKVINIELIKIIVASMVFGIAMYEEIIGASFMFLPVMFMIAYLIVGGDVLYKAFRNLTRGRIFDENFLMSIATIGAIGIGEISEA
ncbi:MAG: cation transporter, partial [Romboutsia sp.]|uniref:heavy-metal-associated domain-containing protein n=1 Tax=Romboutsia sp. TaxID=1965302 RepID=UPI003F3AE42E